MLQAISSWPQRGIIPFCCDSAVADTGAQCDCMSNQRKFPSVLSQLKIVRVFFLRARVSMVVESRASGTWLPTSAANRRPTAIRVTADQLRTLRLSEDAGVRCGTLIL